jgi:hypothetical protein
LFIQKKKAPERRLTQSKKTYEFPDNPVKDHAIIVSIPSVADKVFDGFGDQFRVETTMDIPTRGMDNRGASEEDLGRGGDSSNRLLLPRGLLVEDISIRILRSRVPVSQSISPHRNLSSQKKKNLP